MPSATTPDRRWGAWATALWSVAVMAAFALIQTAFLGAYVATSASGEGSRPQDLLRLATDGDVIAVATLLTTLCCVPMIVGIIKLKRGARLSDYLPLAIPPGRMLGRWLVITAVFAFASDALSLLAGHPVAPQFVRRIYATADFPWLLWAALALAGPVFEETFFRGFMLSGLLRSPLGAYGAAILTSAVWAGVHFQYGWYGIATVFVFGLILAAARLKTASLVTPLALHALVNTLAVLEAAVAQAHA